MKNTLDKTAAMIRACEIKTSIILLMDRGRLCQMGKRNRFSNGAIFECDIKIKR